MATLARFRCNAASQSMADTLYMRGDYLLEDQFSISSAC
jgi:hypothetical protein